ncbi:hypothetical protein [Motilimonas cestriensis]|uniref:hypothetical protein n=1 Tax=Motilimonas cestriensis TaxID=2742685 RepID=UPI003DA4EC0B
MSMLNAQQWHQGYFKMMLEGSKIAQLDADFVCYQQQGLTIPATISHTKVNNSYVVSPLTLITGYAQDEIPKVRFAALRWFSYQLVKIVEKPLQLAGVGTVQTLNNQCLSTNMYCQGWQTINLSKLRTQALQTRSGHALLLRSLNAAQHSPIIERCEQDGWLAIVTRQVYLHTDWSAVVAGKDLKTDLRLLKQPQWTFKKLVTEQEIERAKVLYDALYLGKYSEHNIQFTLSFFRHGVQSGLLSLYGLFYQEEMLACVGMVIIDGDMTCPILGYDLQQPQKLGLYRRASAFTINYAQQHNLRFNMSSGAPWFKRNRKAKAEIEYSYVYCQHLSKPKQWVWKTFAWLTKHFYRPILEKQGL